MLFSSEYALQLIVAAYPFCACSICDYDWQDGECSGWACDCSTSCDVETCDNVEGGCGQAAGCAQARASGTAGRSVDIREE